MLVRIAGRWVEPGQLPPAVPTNPVDKENKATIKSEITATQGPVYPVTLPNSATVPVRSTQISSPAYTGVRRIPDMVGAAFGPYRSTALFPV